MKRLVYALACITALAACKKEDTTPPVITLLGQDSITQVLPLTLNGAIYIDPGAIAEDNEDGPLTAYIEIDNPVNANRKGIYAVVYTVTDKAGNSSTARRTVSIINSMEKFAGAYATSVDSCGMVATPYSAQVTTSDSIDRMIWIGNFGNYGTSIKVRGTVSDTSLSVPTMQYLDQAMTIYINNVFYPETDVLSSATPTRLRIKYSWYNGVTSDTCTTWLQR